MIAIKILPNFQKKFEDKISSISDESIDYHVGR